MEAEARTDDLDDYKEFIELESEESRQKRRILPKSNAGQPSRVIAHIDLDCFYVQVERSHNPDLNDKPVAVVQYNPFGDLKSYAPSDNRFKESGSIIAVSYEARARGVKRIMRGNEAKKVCPEILLVQVPTAHGKADLQIYREASANILKVLGTRYPSIVIERASIDEVYLDLTQEVQKQFQQIPDFHQFRLQTIPSLRLAPTLIAGADLDEIKFSKAKIRDGHTGTTLNNYLKEDLVGCSSAEPQHASSSATTDITATDVVQIDPNEHNIEEDWFSRPTDHWTLEDQLLLVGAKIIQELRQDVFRQLHFTCSAGIAENKMLAKLASGMHKPNKQTLVPKAVIRQMMLNLPYTRVQGFGGKLGEEIQKYFQGQVTTMGELLMIPKQQFLQYFSEETTSYILTRAQGIDEEAVQDRSLPLQIGCSKSFRSSNILLAKHLSDGTIQHWLQELASELTSRMTTDLTQNQRRAKQLHISFSLKIIDMLRNTEGELELIEPRRRNPSTAGATSSNGSQAVGQWFEEQGLSFSKVTKLPLHPSNEQITQLAIQNIVKTLQENTRIQQVMSQLLEFNQLQVERHQQLLAAANSNNSNEGGPVLKQWGITSLGLSATQFEPLPKEKNTITSFLKKKSKAEEQTSGSRVNENPEEDALTITSDHREWTMDGDNSRLSVPSIITIEEDEEGVERGSIEREDEAVLSPTEIKRMENQKRKFEQEILLSLPQPEPSEEIRSKVSHSSSAANSSGDQKLRAFYDKYMKDSTDYAGIDFATFQAFPVDVQKEMMNEVLFTANFQLSSQRKGGATAKKSKHDTAVKSKPLNDWFSRR